MNFKSIYLWFTMTISVCCTFAQTDEISCLKSFNSSVHQTLQGLTSNKVDVSSEQVKLVFELYVSECGRIDSVQLKKSNLKTIGVKENDIVSSITGKVIPCLRNVYYNSELLPDKIIVVYNTKTLLDNRIDKKE